MVGWEGFHLKSFAGGKPGKLNFVKEFKLRGVPTTILLNKEGDEFARIIGDINFEDEKFIEWINNFM